jgi:hypothetical protein
MAPLPYTDHCTNCFGNAVVDVPPATGHLGDLLVRTGGFGSAYQPASRFWAFQSIEAGIFVALTLLVLGAAVWLVHHRAT